MPTNNLKIIAISGSLRPGSSNHSILKFIGSNIAAGIEYNIYEGIDELPHFNPALDVEDAPGPVARWRDAISAADGVIICTPEYAFGVPGSLKNALDWTVSSGSLNQKPAAVITASSGGEKAHAALLNIFTALGANVADGAALLVSFIRTKVNNAGEVTDEKIRVTLIGVLDALVERVRDSKSSG